VDDGTDAVRSQIRRATMSRIVTCIKLACVTLAVAASTGTAIAGEGHGPSFPGNDVPDVVLGRTTFFSAPTGARGVVIGSTLPPVSNGQGEPEPRNSLPPGAERGTHALQRQQVLRSYWAQQAAHAQRPAAPDHQTHR
jgi:hypothetical protein